MDENIKSYGLIRPKNAPIDDSLDQTNLGPKSEVNEGMSNYIGTKRIRGVPMDSITFKKERGIPCENVENQEGYKVIYPDGYVSWSPKRTFEKAYVKTYHSPFVDGKTFGEALEWVRSGEYSMSLPFWDKEKKIKMYFPKDWLDVAHRTCSSLDKKDCKSVYVNLIKAPILEATLAEMTEPFLYVQIGAKMVPWTPSQKELLSDEWIIY